MGKRKYFFLILIIFLVSCNSVLKIKTFDNTKHGTVNTPLFKKDTIPIFIHYMPWFQTPKVSGYWGIHWTMDSKIRDIQSTSKKRGIASHYTPLIAAYDSSDPDYLEYALTTIKLAGIDGIMIDFYGSSNLHDYPKLLEATNLAIAMCKKVGLQFAIVYEDQSLKSIEQSESLFVQAKNDLEYMEEQYFGEYNYFKPKGKPLLLNFGPKVIQSASQWQRLLSTIDTKLSFVSLGYYSKDFNLHKVSNGVFGWVDEAQTSMFYNYAKNYDLVGGAALFEYKEFYAEGGWEPSGQKDVPPKSGRQLRETLQRSKNANVDFIQLITWNDWGEGTAMEPSREYGYKALNIVQKFTGVRYGISELKLARLLYQKRKKHKGNEVVNKQLDQAFYYINSLQLKKAKYVLRGLMTNSLIL